MYYRVSEEYIILTPQGDFNLHKVLYYKKVLQEYNNKKIIFDLSLTRNVNSEAIKFIFSNKERSKVINAPDIFYKCLRILDLELSEMTS